MFPDDPRPIYTDDDLREVAIQMKIAAPRDDHLESYTQSSQEANSLWDRLSERVRNLIVTSGASRAILIDNHLISLVMTTDDNFGKQWHLSMTDIVGPQKLDLVPDALRDHIASVFFGESEVIVNPGALLAVTHMVGNDEKKKE